MAKDIVLSVDGYKELKANLDKMQQRLEQKALNKAARDGAKVIQTEAKQRAPKKTGTLRRGIVVRSGKHKKGEAAMTIGFSKKAWYGRLVELGYLARGRKKVDGKKDQSVRRFISARPFLRPALDTKAAEATKVVGQSLRASLNEWLR